MHQILHFNSKIINRKEFGQNERVAAPGFFLLFPLMWYNMDVDGGEIWINGGRQIWIFCQQQQLLSTFHFFLMYFPYKLSLEYLLLMPSSFFCLKKWHIHHPSSVIQCNRMKYSFEFFILYLKMYRYSMFDNYSKKCIP